GGTWRPWGGRCSRPAGRPPGPTPPASPSAARPRPWPSGRGWPVTPPAAAGPTWSPASWPSAGGPGPPRRGRAGPRGGGGGPGRPRLDRPDLVLLCDPTGQKALDYAGSRVRLGTIRDFPVAGPEDGGSWRRPGTVDRLLDHVSRQAHLAGPLIGATARLLRNTGQPVMGRARA